MMNRTAYLLTTDIPGIMVWSVGLTFEAAADLQLFLFRKDPSNFGKVVDQGLWEYSRHPNHFGAYLAWWGLWLISLSAFQVWTIISSILTTFVLLNMSGITLMEKSLSEANDRYRDYQKRTSHFIPLVSGEKAVSGR